MISNEECVALGLNGNEILTHQARIKEVILTQKRPLFEVRDSCRLANHGILPLPNSQNDTPTWGQGVAAFIPAAGAASRYAQGIFTLVDAIEQGDRAKLLVALSDLKAKGAQSWPLPHSIRRLFDAMPTEPELKASALALLEQLKAPKALMPCVMEGTTFLQVKGLEHQKMPGLEGEIYITPPGKIPEFRKQLPTAKFLEQGTKLSTIRFNRDATPFREKDGKLSIVPAGHGALAQLFPEVKKLYPKADTLFIRNIDNVMGANQEALQACRSFLTFHRQLLTALSKIRQGLKSSNSPLAESGAQEITHLTQLEQKAGEPLETLLTRIQKSVFHTPQAELKDLRKAYDRPLNFLGLVPNTGKDVGGSGVFCKWGDTYAKVCLEVPHASEQDVTKFFKDPSKATHFNPVFCAVEITSDSAYYAKLNNDFWLLAEKSYLGSPVLYHESVLYELIGNSAFANTVFVEVPRSVFNPHKTLSDGSDKSLKSWNL